MHDGEKKYDILHIPKTGGVMLTNYLERYYHDRFRIHCRHSITCRDVDTPVIVVRHPYDRVIARRRTASRRNAGIGYFQMHNSHYLMYVCEIC